MRRILAAAVSLCLAGFTLTCTTEQPTEPSNVATAPSFAMGGNSPTVEFVPALDGASWTLFYDSDNYCKVELTGVTPEDFQRTNPDGTIVNHWNDATADMTFVRDGMTYTGTVSWTGIFYYAWLPPNPMDPPPPRAYVWQWRTNAVGWVTDGDVTKLARCWYIQSGLGGPKTFGMTLR